ncbi:hypothetical protein AB1Y20_019687 [Prymnesium parvum]|uniref:type II protein arginine methyltransferase n=1 Tax=Prymnesium parvum TaxID=97485 RepID=A0AB34JVB6_PRYPA
MLRAASAGGSLLLLAWWAASCSGASSSPLHRLPLLRLLSQSLSSLVLALRRKLSLALSLRRTLSLALSSRRPAAPPPREPPPLYSFCAFMDDSLHHEAWGYYSEGRVRFGENAHHTDFTTFPVSMRPHFGAMLADRLHSFAAQCSNQAAPFLVLELGCGTGVLAHDILARMRQRHPQLYSRVVYVIGERSAALREIQKRTNAAFIAEGRLHVEAVDARDVQLRERVYQLHLLHGGAADAPLRGAVLSNELPDAFAVEKVLVGRRDEGVALQRAIVLPLIRQADLQPLLAHRRAEPTEFARMRATSAATAARLRDGVAAGRVEVGVCGCQLSTRAEAAVADWLAAEGKEAEDAWVALSRDDYCSLKAHCCAAESASERRAESSADSLAAGERCASLPMGREGSSLPDGDQDSVWRGTALEQALDASVCVAELFEVVDNDAPLAGWLACHRAALERATAAGSAAMRLELFVNLAASSFVAGVASLFTPADEGCMLTIDYGADAATLFASARRFPPAAPRRGLLSAASLARACSLRVRSRLPSAAGGAACLAFERPGWCDLTADVDFTQLARAGEAHGLRTVYFGPQTALERLLPTRRAGAPLRCADGAPDATRAHSSRQLRRAVCDAFYSLGTFVMLVQTTAAIGQRWGMDVASFPLQLGQPSHGSFAALATLRSLARVELEHALLLQEEDGVASGSMPSEIDMIRALSDALIPSIPCFKPHWRPMIKLVLAVLSEAQPTGFLCHADVNDLQRHFSPLLLSPLVQLLRNDLVLLRTQ